MGKDGGAPGPPPAIDYAPVEQNTFYTREVHALVVLALVVLAFLIVVGLLYCIHWLCLLKKSIAYRESLAREKSSAEMDKASSDSVAEAPSPLDEDNSRSHSEQISESESIKRCYPSQELTLELDIPKRKRPSEKEATAPIKVLRPLTDYPGIILKNNQMYIDGLTKRPREPPSYLSTLEKPGTQTSIFASQSVSETLMLRTAKPPYSKKYKIIDTMKIASAPILTAPKRSASGSIRTAVEGQRQAVPGQAVQQQPSVQTPNASSTQSTQLVALSVASVPMSTAINPTPVSVPYTGPGVKITGQSSVRTASIAEPTTIAGVKITAAPVSITAMRRKPIPQVFKATSTQAVQPQDTSANIPVNTPMQTAIAMTPKSETSISGLAKSSVTSETLTKTP